MGHCHATGSLPLRKDPSRLNAVSFAAVVCSCRAKKSVATAANET